MVVGGGRPLRVVRYTAGAEILVVVRAVPVAGPLPDVAGHVVEFVSVRGELGDGREAGVAVFAGVLIREVAFMGVGHPLVIRTEVVAPDVGLAGETSAGCELPFGLGGETLACPLRVGL